MKKINKKTIEFVVLLTLSLIVFWLYFFSQVKIAERRNEYKHHRLYSDFAIKKISYNTDLTSKQISLILYRPISNKIHKVDTLFNCSFNDLYIATVSVICLETGNLKSKSTYVNNYFGIKHSPDRPTYVMKTNEYVDGKITTVEDEFVIFFSIEDAVNGFYQLLMNDRYKKVREATNYTDFLYELSESGYATDPNYFTKVYKIAKSIE